MGDEDDEERRLRKEALEAQAEYYRLKTAKLADDIVRTEERRETVRTVARGAAEAGAGFGKLMLAIIGIIVAIGVYFAYTSNEGSKQVTQRALQIQSAIEAGCRDGRYREKRIVRIGGLLELSDEEQAKELSKMSLGSGKVRTCEQVLAGDWP